ncbi:MAG TPA: group 1 truncated hemoglobin, partial [Gemmatimonadales bacterium]|nr:group 1 truncated hemoglobin [Gemmatimonadales bacterium]
AAGGGPAPSTARGGRALYHRLGGYDAIAAVVDDFLRRMIGDSMLAGFFQDMSVPEKNRVRQMLVDQLCEMSGGPCVYVGQDMRTAHQALGITEDDWSRSVSHLVATLDQFKVVGREREELLAAISSLKGEIVQ